MSSATPSNIPLGKIQQQSPAAPSASQNEQPSSQRSYSNSGGSSASNRNSVGQNQANPRNIQANKNKHKSSRKPSMQRDDTIAETVAMHSNNNSSRKGRTSITHLMDWTAPRPQFNNHHGFGGGSHTRPARRTWGMGSGYHAVDKARYVNANYRFIVNPDGDYRPQSIDPDATLSWDSILQIIASSQTQSTSCPICLGDPVAPRMAKCGHIFCLSCLIRYIASEDDAKPQPGYNANDKKPKWKKCPICYDSVYVAETRPVKFFTGQENPQPREANDVVLRLMVRQPGSSLALPKDVAGSMTGARRRNTEDPIPWHFAAEVTDYARIMKGTEKYMVAEYEREIEELEEMGRVDELMFGEEGDWVRKAVAKIRNATETVRGIGSSVSVPTEKNDAREELERHLLEEAEKEKEKEQEKKPEIKWNQGEVEVPDMYLYMNNSQSGLVSPTFATPTASNTIETKLPQQPIPSSPTKTRHFGDRRSHQPIIETLPTEPYYFYQSLPHSYLSPLDIRILRTAFGSFSSFPTTVLPRVENFSPGHLVDDDLRKRAKYLSHLPYGCEVAFLECDWTDIVPADVLERFQPDIDRRRKKKREKDTKEERDRIRAERQEEDERFAAARIRHRRPVTEEEMVSAALAASQVHAPDLGISGLAINEEPDALFDTSARTGFSSLPQSSPPSSRTVWGTPLIKNPHEDDLPTTVSSAPEPQGWLQDWEQDMLLQSHLQEDQGMKSQGKGKGKKFKKVTLMTNGGLRRGA